METVWFDAMSCSRCLVLITEWRYGYSRQNSFLNGFYFLRTGRLWGDSELGMWHHNQSETQAGKWEWNPGTCPLLQVILELMTPSIDIMLIVIISVIVLLCCLLHFIFAGVDIVEETYCKVVESLKGWQFSSLCPRFLLRLRMRRHSSSMMSCLQSNNPRKESVCSCLHFTPL